MMTELLRAAGTASLSAGVMVLAVFILRQCFQDHTPRKVFCLLWDIVLLRLLVLAALPSPVSVWNWLPNAPDQPAAVQEEMTAVVTAANGTLVQADRLPAQVEGITYVSEDAFQTLPGTAAKISINWEATLAAVWAVTALLMAFGFLWNHLRSRKIYAASLPCRDPYVRDWIETQPLRRPVRVRVSDRIDAPLTYGIWYPVILLPRGIGDREILSCIFAHELNHIRRFDALRKVFLAAALCLHWFNPLVWAMYVLANRDIELACDEAVLHGGADREQYALALLGMEERRGGWKPSGSHFSSHALEERIKAIMKRKHISITALAAVLVVMCITTTVFASAAPEKKTDQNSPQTATYVYDHLQMVEDTGISILSKGGEGGEKLYSDDEGKTWMSEEAYQAKYGSWGDDWQVEWWTYEDYKVWLAEEKEALQSIIGERGYTSTDGWFTWDQKKVDESIAMYENILEEIKNGALHSKTIIDKNGNEVEDVALGSDGPMVVSTFEENIGDTVSVSKSLDEAALRAELKAFGIEGNENLMTYKGELVRYFVDGASVGDSGYSVQYVYRNDSGTVDLHTLRAVVRNPDGSYDTMGDLTGLAVKGDENFDQGLMDAAVLQGSSPQATATDGDDSTVQEQNNAEPARRGHVYITGDAVADAISNGQGMSFEEIFAQYEKYGLTYQIREDAMGAPMGALVYNGLPVSSFADLKPDGGVFSYNDPHSPDGLKVRTVYDENGNLTGLTADPATVGKPGADKAER